MLKKIFSFSLVAFLVFPFVVISKVEAQILFGAKKTDKASLKTTLDNCLEACERPILK